ncbi:MAG: sugar phosphate isomerase/epimerase family protein [Verrucomicrobiota bacterium]
MNIPLADRVAVCSWSLQPTGGRDLVDKIRATGISRIQLALDPLLDPAADWKNTPDLLAQNHIAITSGMFGCIGEDYSTLESIRVTGGIAPDATWSRNLANIERAAALAAQLRLKLVTFHAGFLPHSENDPDFRKLLDRLVQVANVFAARNISLGLETGQETAGALAAFLHKLGRADVGVNFDPANMILYNKGNPIEALRVLGPWIKQVHIKDAVRTKVPGTWGEEVPAGTGEVRWPDFFQTLRQSGYRGDFVIEREAGQQRVADIRTARTVIETHAA